MAKAKKKKQSIVRQLKQTANKSATKRAFLIKVVGIGNPYRKQSVLQKASAGER